MRLHDPRDMRALREHAERAFSERRAEEAGVVKRVKEVPQDLFLIREGGFHMEEFAADVRD